MKSKILVVDDEEAVRDLLFRSLTRLGKFQVEVAEDGEEALKKVENGEFNLILTDLNLPKVDGIELIKRVATARPEILTIMLTGYGSLDSAVEAMKMGASDYLTKPPNVNELVLRVRKVLEERTRLVSLKNYAAELEKANQELKRLDQMKSEFVSIASHELRTPLSAIKNSVQLILKGKTGAINETQTKFLSMAERNIDRLTNILNDLLDLSRIESGRVEYKIEELELNRIIESTISSFTPQADVKGIQIETALPSGLPHVYGDDEKIQ